jgi:hypothetical protein
MLSFLLEGGISISIKKEVQIDIMIDEGLGGGQIKERADKKRLQSPLSKSKQTKKNVMVKNMTEAIKLGKEMEQLQEKDELLEKGLTPDPDNTEK